MDMLSALMSPLSKEDELKALADSLRKRKQAADFYSLSTIKPLQAMGQRAGEEVVGTAERQGVLREALARRQQEQAEQQARIAAQQAENEADRKWRTGENLLDREALLSRALASQGQGSERPKYGTTTKTYELPDGRKVDVFVSPNGPAIDSTTQETIDLTGARQVTEMTEGQFASRLEKLGERNRDLQPLIYGLQELDAVLKPYDEAGYKTDEVPGMGLFEKGTGVIGGITRLAQDVFSEGAPQGDVYSSVQAIMNYIAKARAGLAQTLPEVVRIEKELGKDMYSDPEVFMKAYPKLKRAILGATSMIRATTPKEVLDTYRSNLMEGEVDITDVRFDDVRLDGKKKGEQAKKQQESAASNVVDIDWGNWDDEDE